MASEHQILSLIEQLERKIRVLKSSYDRAKRRAQDLENEKADLTKQLKEQQDLLRQLEKKQPDLQKKGPMSKDFGKLVKDNLSGTDTNAKLKQQLDEYIRGIDRCIAQLSRLS